MKTQISRDSHVGGKRYSGVYQQQGRMITDADWNELVNVVKERLQRSLAEIVGSGVPREARLHLENVGGEIKILPGAAYADGARGELPGTEAMSFTSQPDFPHAPAPASAVRVYVDLWERTVVSLEDRALRDPGLHGADTCARTQTTVQVKWCAQDVEPTDPAANPAIGDAVFSAELWDNSEAGERADPCLTATVERPRIGNYLFRVEVHDVERMDSAGNDIKLTLKWSSENAAEQQALVWRDEHGTEQRNYQNLPPEFSAGHWIYEVYNDVSEKHLGHHLAGSFTPARGVLLASLTEPPPQIGSGSVQEAAQYVRRWDGYGTLRLRRTGAAVPWGPVAVDGTAGGSLIVGQDKGQTLRTDTPGFGYVDFPQEGANRRLRASLEGLVLTLELDTHVFLPGDYWLAVVREGAEYFQGSGGSTIVDRRVEIPNAGNPIGIRHHYLEIAKLSGGAIDPYTPGSGEERRLDFPPLSNLSAERIRYEPGNQGARWDDINEVSAGGPRRPITVQEAIDDLAANLESSDITYVLPPCDATSYGVDTLKKLLQPDIGHQVIGSDGKTRTKIEDLWNALLCKLDASRVPYDPTGSSGRWADISEQVWVRQFGGVGNDQNRGLAIDNAGDIVVTGSFEGTAAFGDRALTSAGASDLYLAKLDLDGNVRWARRFGAAADQQGDGLALDPANNIVLVGRFSGTLDLGGGVPPLVSAAGMVEVFVAKFDPDGGCLWAQRLSGAKTAMGNSLAVDKNGEIVVAGSFLGSLAVGGVTLTSDGAGDVFLAKLGPDGATRWAKGFGGTGRDLAYAVATDADANIILTGATEGAISFGGPTLPSAGGFDIFVAKLTSSGAHVWSRLFGGTLSDYGLGLAVDRNGDIFVTGYFQGTVSIGGPPLVSAGGYDAFVAKLKSADGAHIWSKRFGGTDADLGYAIAVDSADNVVLAGFFRGSANFGGSDLVSGGGYAAFVAVLDTAGAHVHSTALGGRGMTFGRNLAIGPGGAIVLAGYFSGSTEFGGVPLTSAGPSDAFVTNIVFDATGPSTVQAAIDELLRQLDSGDIAYAVPLCGSERDSLRRRLPSLGDLDDGASTRVAQVLDAMLCELDAGAIPYAARDVSAPSGSVRDLMVKKIGDAMTGPLTINTGQPADTLLDANGVIGAKGLRLNLGATPDKSVLTYDAPTGLAKWLETSLTAWDLSGGNLSTDPTSVTGSVTLGSPEAQSLHITADGKVGIGTHTPATALHIVAETGSDSPGYGLPWAGGKHIADGATQMWGLQKIYGRVTTWDTDSLFIGLKDEGADRKDAVIAWGDNPDDSLRFMFTAPGNPAPAPVEVLRITPSGGVLVPHSADGGPTARALEVGSQDTVTANSPNGRIGFPGHGVRHGQLRWMPTADANARFEFIDSSANSPSGDYGVNPVFASIKALNGIFQGDLSLVGALRSHQFKVTEVMHVRAGPLPLTGSFSSSGGVLVAYASGSAWSSTTDKILGFQLSVDGLVMGESKVFTNEERSHKAFPPIFTVITGGTSVAGNHTVRLQPWTTDTITDFNDFFTVIIVELPFRSA